MRHSIPKMAVAVFLSAVVMMVSACFGGTPAAPLVQGPWEDVVAAAEKEGRVNLYSVGPPVQNKRLVEAFNETYPDIKVDITRGAGELPGRVVSEIESESEGADVFLYTDPEFFTDISDDLLVLDGPNVTGWSEDFWAVESRAIIPTRYPWTMFVWNTDVFPQGFRTWDDLLAPEVTGRLATRSDVTASMAGTLDFMEQELGPDYLKALGKQNPKFYASAVPMGQAVASGEAGVTYISTPSIFTDLKDQGAPVDFAYPKPGFAIEWGGGAPATSKRPNAARVFMDFLMSDKGQAALNSDGLGAAGRPDIEGSIDMSGWTVFDSRPFDPRKLNDMKGEFANYFKR